MSVFTWIGKAASSVGKWLATAFKDITQDAAPVAVSIIEELQTLFKTGTTGFIASILDSLVKSQLPTEIINAVGAALPKLLAGALALEGLATNPTDAQIEAFEQAVLSAFNVTPDKSQLYSTVGAQFIAIIRSNTAPGQKFTFAVLVADLEAAYQDLQQDLAGNTTND
jgi:hypothetical protein